MIQQNKMNLNSNFQLETKTIYAYKPNQILKCTQKFKFNC